MVERIPPSRDELVITRATHTYYNGKIRKLTKDCEGCDFHLVFDDGLETCEWGVAWKELSPVENPRRCVSLNSQRPSPRMEEVEKYREWAARGSEFYELDEDGRLRCDPQKVADRLARTTGHKLDSDKPGPETTRLEDLPLFQALFTSQSDSPEGAGQDSS